VRYAEVGYPWLAVLTDEDIFRLQIPVHYSVRVQARDAESRAEEEPHSRLNLPWVISVVVCEIAQGASCARHDIERKGIRTQSHFSGGYRSDHVRVPDRRGELDLAFEPRQCSLV
jgi:hypothetical protein